LAYCKSKQRKISLLATIAIVFTNILFAPNVFAQPRIPDVEIPVEPVTMDELVEGQMEAETEAEEQAERTVDYTEDLWDIAEEGIFDIFGDMKQEIIEEPTEKPDESIQQMSEEEAAFEAYRQSIIESWGGKKIFTEKRLEGIKENLSEQMKRFMELEKEIAEAQDKLTPIREEVSTLQDQLKLLNTEIQTAKKKITNTEVLVAEKKIEIKDLMLNLKRSEIEMQIQQGIVMDYVKLLYDEEYQYFNFYDEGTSTLKLLLADASVSENLLGKEYLAIMEETGRKVFYDLERTNRDLQEKQNTILDEQRELEFLYNELLKEKRSIEETRLAKKELLEATQGEEEKYQMLLENAIQEQLETAIAVQNLQENIQLIEEKLDTLDDGLEEIKSVKAEEVIEGDGDIIEMIGSDEVQADTEEGIPPKTPFIWPVPANKITATFHDPTYPKRWGIHNAIDIRAPQFTEIRAPANGYVFQTKDNGNGYNYIIIAHKNNLVTVYGHVAEIIAKPGTIVKQGEVIGLSGGTPGTKGAGLQTTGPHLHFEVHYKGEPVNPLDYLPIEELPLEYVPDEYLISL
jgi:murein DD-endopeptidase MepM/ murein hydrolase activator NlpD